MGAPSGARSNVHQAAPGALRPARATEGSTRARRSCPGRDGASPASARCGPSPLRRRIRWTGSAGRDGRRPHRVPSRSSGSETAPRPMAGRPVALIDGAAGLPRTRPIGSTPELDARSSASRGPRPARPRDLDASRSAQLDAPCPPGLAAGVTTPTRDRHRARRNAPPGVQRFFARVLGPSPRRWSRGGPRAPRRGARHPTATGSPRRCRARARAPDREIRDRIRRPDSPATPVRRAGREGRIAGRGLCRTTAALPVPLRASV
jgi:hypothetical protein